MQNFNVGDKVKVVKIIESDCPYSDLEGQIGKVVNFNIYHGYTIRFEDGDEFSIYEKELQKVEEDFKIGEEVYINFANSDGLKLINQKGQIIDSKNEMFLVQYFDGELDVEDSRYFSINYISKQPINTKPDNQNVKMKTPEQIDSEIKDLEAKIQSLKQEKENQNFEVGDWFTVLEDTSLGFYKAGNLYEIIEIKGDDFYSRFSEFGTGKAATRSNCRKATPAEIEAHLIKLAEESGLKVGEEARTIHYIVPEQRKIVKFKLYSSETKNKNSIGCSGYLEENNLKYGLAVSYNNGFCSYPFDYISYLSQKFQPKITINGYNAEFCEGFVKFGCAKFVNSTFTEAKRLIDLVNGFEFNGNVQNRHVENIKLGAGIFTPTDIENIVKRLKN